MAWQSVVSAWLKVFSIYHLVVADEKPYHFYHSHVINAQVSAGRHNNFDRALIEATKEIYSTKNMCIPL